MTIADLVFHDIRVGVALPGLAKRAHTRRPGRRLTHR